MVVNSSLMPSLAGSAMPKDTVHFVTERSAADAAQEISMQPWQDWIKKAQPPFGSMVIEWKPIDMIESMKRYGNRFAYTAPSGKIATRTEPETDGLFDVEAMVITDSKIWFHIGAFSGQSMNIMLPWVIELNKPRDPSDPDQIAFEKLAFGVGYEKQFGSYPDVRIRRDYSQVKTKFATIPDEMLTEFAGIVRFGLAMLALINTERETIPTVGYKRSTLKNGKIIKLPETRLVVIRPDSARKVYEKSEPTGIKHRDHEVRRHLRNYKNGKTAWVREHRRGDKSIGTVNKRYIVEMDPNL